MADNLQVNTFITQLFTQIKDYCLSPEEAKISQRDIADYIFRKINRKAYRRKKLGETSAKGLKDKIQLSVKENKPIHFVIPFGGYKHFWNPSHPEPDWAELFNFRYLTEYVLSILPAYKPGVILEYISEDLILPRMNNYPDEAIETYIETFKQILRWYKQYVPPNLDLQFFRVSDRCNKEKIIAEVEALLPERMNAFHQLTQEQKDIELKRSNRSIYWNGKKDLEKLHKEEKQARIIESRMIELAYYEIEAKPEYLGNYLGEDNHICICFSFGLSPDNVYDDLTLGSTFSSIVDYWIGRGVLESGNNKLTPRIVSHKQYDAIKNSLQSIDCDLPIPGKNYKTIEVIPSHLP